MMNDAQKDFEKFMQRRTAAASAYANGEVVALREIAARELPATFFGPKGGHADGAAEVWRTYEKDAQVFERGSESTLEILQMAASDDVAYWVGFQRAAVRMRGAREPIQFNLRVTEIFRRENSEWKLVHRHADPLAEVPEENASSHHAPAHAPSR
jgi:ketosteroid isomerase-like protein